ncbi:LysR family transcriptional regulator [Pseudomonas fulva]|uniref:LysR family transcriptional regulator n=1 Tax=Pseudomonas fulva TaxID=47880 RepID=UPI003EE9BC7A
MEPTLKQLKAFVLSHRLGSLTRAAEQLFITQSAVSVLLQQLEEGLGIKLFDRTTRSLKPTAGANELLTIAERVLRDIQAIQIGARGIVERSSGNLVFASTPSVAAALLPSIMKDFSNRYPGIKIRMHDLPPERLVAAVMSEEVEFSIGTLAAPPEGVQLSHLLTDHLSLIVSRESSLATHERITWEDVLKERCITVKLGQGIRELIDGTLARLNAKIAPDFEVTYMSTALSMASAGLGAAVLPAALLDAFAYNNLVAKRIHDPVVLREIHLIRRAKSSLSPAAEAFIEVWNEHIEVLGLEQLEEG